MCEVHLFPHGGITCKDVRPTRGTLQQQLVSRVDPMYWAPWAVRLCSLSLGLGPEGHRCSDHCTHSILFHHTATQARPCFWAGRIYSGAGLTSVLGVDPVLLKLGAEGSGVGELPIEIGRNPCEAAIPSAGSPTRNNKGFFPQFFPGDAWRRERRRGQRGCTFCGLSSIQFSRSVVSDSL